MAAKSFAAVWSVRRAREHVHEPALCEGESCSAQLNTSVQPRLRYAQSHALAVRMLAPITLVGCVSELLNEAALCEWAAPNEAHQARLQRTHPAMG